MKPPGRLARGALLLLIATRSLPAFAEPLRGRVELAIDGRLVVLDLCEPTSLEHPFHLCSSDLPLEFEQWQVEESQSFPFTAIARGGEHHGEHRREALRAFGASFWREQRYEVDAAIAHDAPLHLLLVPSIEVERPLGDDYPSVDPTEPAPIFVDDAVREVNPLEGGGLASVSAFGASLALFGFLGPTRGNEEVVYMQQLLPMHEHRESESSLGAWYGAHFDFDRFGVWLHAEKLWSTQGPVRREGIEVETSYTVQVELFGRLLEVEPIVSYSELRVATFPAERAPQDPWDGHQLSFGTLLRPHHLVELTLERSVQAEREEALISASVETEEVVVLLELDLSEEVF
jgi:hypothetical protein